MSSPRGLGHAAKRRRSRGLRRLPLVATSRTAQADMPGDGRSFRRRTALLVHLADARGRRRGPPRRPRRRDIPGPERRRAHSLQRIPRALLALNAPRRRGHGDPCLLAWSLPISSWPYVRRFLLRAFRQGVRGLALRRWADVAGVAPLDPLSVRHRLRLLSYNPSLIGLHEKAGRAQTTRPAFLRKLL